MGRDQIVGLVRWLGQEEHLPLCNYGSRRARVPQTSSGACVNRVGGQAGVRMRVSRTPWRYSEGMGNGRRSNQRVTTLRLAHSGFLLIWRRYSPPAAEVRSLQERHASRHQARAERDLAAEKYHRLVIGERQRPERKPMTGVASAAAVAVGAPPLTTRSANTGQMLYLNYCRAESGFIEFSELAHDYVLTCRFLHCGIIDRTATLDPGFRYEVLDPIPAPGPGGLTFAELCDAVGAEIVSEARRAGRGIRVLWSGGIDSTCALIAIMKAADAQGCQDQVEILLSLDSVHEYAGFFLRHIGERYGIRCVTHPLSAYLDPTFVNVTGEHGDQLFGSQLLEPYVRRGLGGIDYRDILPLVIVERLGSVRGAYRVYRYLEPVFAAATVPIRTLFDAMWWLNFSLKWQDVTLRLPACCGEQAGMVYASLRHFFRDDRFQAWSLAYGAERLPPVWARYKDVAKRYILAFTGDGAYFRFKEKEGSLRSIMVDPWSGNESRIQMGMDFRPAQTIVERIEP